MSKTKTKDSPVVIQGHDQVLVARITTVAPR